MQAPANSTLTMNYALPWPDDLFALHGLALTLNPTQQASAFSELEVQLSGFFNAYDPTQTSYPLAALARGKLPGDPPEFFPLIVQQDGLRVGYWVDEPAAAPAYVVVHQDPNHFRAIARNLLEYLRLRLESLVAAGHALGLDVLRAHLLPYATANRPETGHDYLQAYESKAFNTRLRLITALTPEGMGLILPAASYLPQHLTQQPSIAQGYEALKQGYAGTALWHAKHSGNEPAAAALAMAAYRALGWDIFADFIQPFEG